jgi:hypothetical protein
MPLVMDVARLKNIKYCAITGTLIVKNYGAWQNGVPLRIQTLVGLCSAIVLGVNWQL